VGRRASSPTPNNPTPVVDSGDTPIKISGYDYVSNVFTVAEIILPQITMTTEWLLLLLIVAVSSEFEELNSILDNQQLQLFQDLSNQQQRLEALESRIGKLHGKNSLQTGEIRQ